VCGIRSDDPRYKLATDTVEDGYRMAIPTCPECRSLSGIDDTKYGLVHAKQSFDDKEKPAAWLQTHRATARTAARHCPDLQDRRVKNVSALLEELAAEGRIPSVRRSEARDRAGVSSNP